jgi:hypothetical protein
MDTAFHQLSLLTVERSSLGMWTSSKCCVDLLRPPRLPEEYISMRTCTVSGLNRTSRQPCRFVKCS